MVSQARHIGTFLLCRHFGTLLGMASLASVQAKAAKRAPSQISYPNNLVPSELLLLSAADGTAGSCLLNLFEVSNDLGSAFLDGFAVGTHNKAA